MRGDFHFVCVLFVSTAVLAVEEGSLSQCHNEGSGPSTNMMQIEEHPDFDSESEEALQAAFDVGKYTVAGERGSPSAFKFLNRYMKMEPREDTPWGNLITCEGAPPAFVARNDLVWDGAGKCTLATSPGPKVHLPATAAEDADGVVAVALDDDVFFDCTFMNNKSFSFQSWHYDSYEMATSSKRQCCLACQGDSECIGANYVPGTRSEPYIGFGVHVPTSGSRGTGDGLNVSVVEEIVTAKLGKLDRFDAWLDYSLGLWTTDLDSYMQAFDSEGLPYLTAEWTTGTTQAFSIFIHVKDSQLILELMTTNSTKLQHQEGLVNLEPRLPESFLLHLIEQNVSGTILKEARIGRAATDLDSLDEFYTEGMRIRPSFTHEGEDVSVRCYEWSMGTPQVCYTKRPDSKTKGWFKVGVFEDMLKDSAMQFADNALCIMNRWFDNHYSVTADDVSDHSIFNYIIDYLDEHPEIPIACNPTAGLYYIGDPSGWAVQTPSGIGTILPRRCGGGQRSTDSYMNTTAEFVFCEMGTCSLQ